MEGPTCDYEMKARLQRIADWLGLDEILAVTDTYDQADRLRSYEILADVAKEIEVKEPVAA